MYDECAIDFCYSFADAQEVFRIRRLVYNLLESKSSVLNLDRALIIVDEITTRGPLGCHAVLGGIYERLYRRRGLYLALELLEFCVRNCGLDFAVFLRRPFLKAMTRLLKLKSLSEQTFVGQVNSTVKSLIKATKTNIIAQEPVEGHTKQVLKSTDVLLVRCQKKVLYLFQLWADAFMMQEDRVPDILNMYRELRRKGYPFPQRDVQQRFLIKHAENSPAFICGPNSLQDFTIHHTSYQPKCLTDDPYLAQIKHGSSLSLSSLSSSKAEKTIERFIPYDAKLQNPTVVDPFNTQQSNRSSKKNSLDSFQHDLDERWPPSVFSASSLASENHLASGSNNTKPILSTVPTDSACQEKKNDFLIDQCDNNRVLHEKKSTQEVNSFPSLPSPPKSILQNSLIKPMHKPQQNHLLEGEKILKTPSQLPLQQDQIITPSYPISEPLLIVDVESNTKQKDVFEDLLGL